MTAIRRGCLALLGTIAVASSTASAADKPVVVVETSLGNITIELEPEKAPKTVENFLKYVDEGYYNGTIFHRVIGPNPPGNPDGFMIQGGGFDQKGVEKKTRPPIPNESLAFNKKGMSNQRGTIAMARTPDPNSATSQFFINLSNKNEQLDEYQRAGYAAFGKVIGGMDVVDKIAKVETGVGKLTSLVDGEPLAGTHQDVPLQPVVIKTIKRKAK